MKNKYYSNYFKSITQGLKDSKYYTNQQLSEPETFFQIIKDNLKKIRETKNKIYLLVFVFLGQNYFLVCSNI